MASSEEVGPPRPFKVEVASVITSLEAFFERKFIRHIRRRAPPKETGFLS